MDERLCVYPNSILQIYVSKRNLEGWVTSPSCGKMSGHHESAIQTIPRHAQAMQKSASQVTQGTLGLVLVKDCTNSALQQLPVDFTKIDRKLEIFEPQTNSGP